jgi:hypothetical protein
MYNRQIEIEKTNIWHSDYTKNKILKLTSFLYNSSASDQNGTGFLEIIEHKKVLTYHGHELEPEWN